MVNDEDYKVMIASCKECGKEFEAGLVVKLSFTLVVEPYDESKAAPTKPRRVRKPRSLNPELAAAVEHAAAHPEEPLADVAGRFRTVTQTLRYHLKRLGLFVAHDSRRARKPRKLHAHPLRPEIVAATEHVLAHPEEPIKDVAARFGLHRHTLPTCLRRRGLFVPNDQRRINNTGKNQSNRARLDWSPILSHAEANLRRASRLSRLASGSSPPRCDG